MFLKSQSDAKAKKKKNEEIFEKNVKTITIDSNLINKCIRYPLVNDEEQHTTTKTK